MKDRELLAEMSQYYSYNPHTGFFTCIKRKPFDGMTVPGRPVGCINKYGYVNLKHFQKRYLAHRIAWLFEHGHIPAFIDHINGNKSDNRISNLRPATKRQNSNNKQLHRDGRLPGCYFHKPKQKWMARYKVKNKSFFIGYFHNEKEAHIAYINKLISLGEVPVLETKGEKMKPSIGRIVHYQKYGTPGGEHKSEPSAAVITKVINDETQECQLFVMNPNGVYFNATPFSDEPKPGHWSWPPKT